MTSPTGGSPIFLVAVGLGSAFMLLRLGQAFERLSSLIKGTERDLLPVIVKAGATVDRVNYQLDKADTVTDSAVSMADSADTAVRAISTAITTPVEKVSGLAAGLTHGFSQFRKSRSFADATTTAREAARNRESDLREDLRQAGRTPDGDGATGSAAATGSPAEAGSVAPTGAGGEAGTGARATGRADRRVGDPATIGVSRRRYDRLMRTTAELREGFLAYFESKGHLRRPSAPLIPPSDDPSTLFIVAGMQPMKRWFLGLEPPPATRVATSQKVMRAGGKHADLDDVGSTARHALATFISFRWGGINRGWVDAFHATCNHRLCDQFIRRD